MISTFADVFIYVNLMVALFLFGTIGEVVSVDQKLGRKKVILVYIQILSVFYVAANVLCLLYRPAIIFLSDLRPIYDCVMLMLFSITVRHLLGK